MKEQIYKPEKEKYGKRTYIGNYNGEELYICPTRWDCGWYWGGVYLEGLRPETEDDLIEQASDVSLSDYYDVKDIPSQYLNEEQFKEDMKDDWYDRADVQAEEEREGETYYLCFGCHTHCDSVLLNECEGSFTKALEVFDKMYLCEEDFNKLISLLKEFYNNKEGARDKNYLKRMKKQEDILKELEIFLNKLPEFPNKDFWVNPEAR